MTADEARALSRAELAIEERIERLEEVAERWDVPGGSRRLARRARDKAEGLRAARRLIRRVRVEDTATATRLALDPDTYDLDPRQET